LKEAAVLTGLSDPYVYITKLGDFSVSYKIHGFLEDSTKYFSTNSLLNANVMDVLHKRKIEIVSPTFMNQINASDKIFIPKEIVKTKILKNEKKPEDLIFDEAIKSEKNENNKDKLKKLTEQQKLLRKKQKDLTKDDEIDKNESSIKNIDKLKLKVEESIEKQNKDDHNK